MIWVTTATTNACSIYNYDKQHATLSLLKEIKHPELKLKNSDMTSDKPGHYQAGDARGAYSPHTDAKHVEIDRFSKEIADELDKGRKDNSYKSLIIITPPHMNGLLFQHLNKHVKELIIHNIQKDLLHLNHRDLLEFLKTNAQYPNQSS